MAAESGYAPAQFNVAYLCEQHMVRLYSWKHACRLSICTLLTIICPLDIQLGFLGAEFAHECTVKYYNLTIQSQNPDPSGKWARWAAHFQICLRKHTTAERFYVCPAFTKLGDLLYEGRGRRQRDLKSAAEMYSKAALSKEPQVGVLEIDFQACLYS